ncbi:MAG: hypothetical protein IKV54_03665 [Clostridia bacterium]|nr:hypothetical protein [Clostridia bacterium]
MEKNKGIKLSFEITAPITFAAAYTEGKKSLVIGLEGKGITVTVYCASSAESAVLTSPGMGQTGERIEIDIFDSTARLYRNGALECEKALPNKPCFTKETAVLSPDLSVTAEDTEES